MKSALYIFTSFFFFCSVILSQWSTDPSAPQSLGSGIQAQAVSTPDGGLYVAWLSDGNYHVYLQYLNPLGEPQLGQGGIVVSDNQNASWIAVYHLNLGVDQEGNAIISTVDQRTGSVWEVYAYKVGSDGTMYWGSDGLALSSSSVSNMSPRLAVTNENSVIVTWTHNDNTVLFQHISPSGSLLWGDGIHITDNDATLISPNPIITSDNNILVQWIRQTGPFWAANSELYLQKYDHDGNPLWNDPVVAAGPVVFPMGNWSQQLLPDANSGNFLAWTEMSGNVQNAKTQHTDADGNLLWAGAVEFSGNSSHFRISPKLAIAESSQDLIAVWNESNSSQTQRGVYAQRLDNGGNKLWGSNGTPVIELNGNYDYLDLSVNPLGDDIISTYIEQTVTMNGDIYATRLDQDGNPVWLNSRIAVTSSGTSKSDMMTAGGLNFVFIVWTENGSVYGHCLRSDGTFGPPDVTPPPLISDQQIAEDEELNMDLSYLGETMTYEAYSDTSAVSAVINGQSLLLTPLPNWHGISTITVYMTDDSNLLDTASFVLTVTSVNDPPTIEPVDDITMEEDGSASVFLNVTDADSENLIYNFYTSQQQPIFSFTVIEDTLYISPILNWNGQENLTIFVSDGEDSDNTSLVITVTPVNDAPTINPIDDITIVEDSTTSIIIYSEDIDSEDLEYDFMTDDPYFDIMHVANMVTISPHLNWSGQGYIIVSVSDGQDSADAGFTITVTPVNDRPESFTILNPTISDTFSTDIANDTLIPFSWQQSYDVDSDVTYKLTIELEFSGNVYTEVYENINDTTVSISSNSLDQLLSASSQSVSVVTYLVEASDEEFTVASSDRGFFVLNRSSLGVGKGQQFPEIFALHQNYPNPFNPITSIRYDLPQDAFVHIRVYDMLGRMVRSLANSQQAAGYHSIQWDAASDKNEPASAGIYIYTIQAGEFSHYRKMVLLK